MTRDEPVGEGEHVVRHGEDLHSIAFRHRVAPDDIWTHPSNADLAAAREQHLLLPGDRLVLPESDPACRYPVQPGGSHRFQAQVPRHEVRLRLRSGRGEHPAERYTAVADGIVHEGTIDSSGEVVITVRPSTRHVTLTIHEVWEDFTHDNVLHLDLGGLDPATSATGVQARLRNLGLDVGRVDGDIGPRTRRAIAALQRRHGIDPTGELCDETRQRLLDEHGC